MSEFKETKELKKKIKEKDQLLEQAVLNKVETLDEKAEFEPEIPEQEKPAENPEEFNRAIAFAQYEGKEWIEVNEKMFKFLVKNNQTKYLTYGKPGVKVYIAGTREKIEKEEKMNAVEYANYIGKSLDAK